LKSKKLFTKSTDFLSLILPKLIFIIHVENLR
jgi:hypothetical protein